MQAEPHATANTPPVQVAAPFAALAPAHLVAQRHPERGGVAAFAATADTPARWRAAIAVSRALAEIHAAGLVHAAFKPDAIQIDAASGEVAVADWDLARTRWAAPRPGHPGARPGASSDLHGLGEILALLLPESATRHPEVARAVDRLLSATGQLPAADSVADVLDAVHRGLTPHCLPIRPQSRRSDATHLLLELARSASAEARRLDTERLDAWIATVHALADDQVGRLAAALPELSGLFERNHDAPPPSADALLALADALPGHTTLVLEHADSLPADVLAQFVMAVSGGSEARHLVLLTETHLNALNLLEQRIEVLPLLPLDVHAVAIWLAAATGRQPPSDSPLATRLTAATGGNPGLIQVQLLLWLAGGELTFDALAQAWHWPRDSSPLLDAATLTRRLDTDGPLRCTVHTVP